MINSVLCTECICLAICVSKTDANLIIQCKMMENTVLNITASMKEGDYMIIQFRGLERSFSIQKAEALLVVDTDDPIYLAGKFYLRPLLTDQLRLNHSLLIN